MIVPLLEIPVGGRLLHFVRAWEEITTDKFVLGVVSKGYKVEFSQTPPMSEAMKFTSVPSNKQKAQISKICIPGKSLPVRSSPFRNLFRTKGICQDNLGSTRLSEESEVPSSCIPGRLASSRTIPRKVILGSSEHDTTANQVRFSSELAEVSALPYSGFPIHRSLFPSRPRAGLSSKGKNLNTKKTVLHSRAEGEYSSTVCASDPGSDELMHRGHTMGKTTHETHSAFSPLSLETQDERHICSHPSQQVVNRVLPLVERGDNSVQRQNTDGQISRFSPNYRCVGRGLGGPHREFEDLREMGSTRDIERYQLEGTESSSISNYADSSTSTRKEGSGTVGQLNSSNIHKQAGGNSFSRTLYVNLETSPILYNRKDRTKVNTHTRQVKPDCRCSIQEVSDHSNRMDSSETDTEPGILFLERTSDRSVRLKTKSSVACIHVSSPRQPGFGCRCSSSELDRNVCLCISSNIPSSTGDQEGPSGTHDLDLNSTILGETSMVSRPNRSADRAPNQITSEGGHNQAASQRLASSIPRHTEVDCMEAVRRQYSEEGFSRAVANRAVEARRPSTYQTYNAKLNLYSKWAAEKRFDPFSATVAQIADFMEYLFSVKNLQVRTIQGYRSAISLIHPGWNGVKVGNHPRLEKLLKAYFNSRPSKRKLSPTWSLTLVLNMLMKAPFEPLIHVPLKFLTLKTVFLVAISSGRRRSGLQALCCKEGHIRWDQTGVALIPHPGFLAKNDSLSYVSKRIFLPKMASLSSVEEDRLVCPCRALSQYLLRTKKFRKGVEQLFVTYKDNLCHAASRDTISRWIVQTIERCYKESTDTDFSMAKAHDTRSLSTSMALFKGISMEEIMEAASWKSESTFTNHYLKNMSQETGRFARAVLTSERRQ
ncbi:uncharacterized protein LOC110455211 [Mizuhopecten yessoensis]|uniref:uncharacterized protein LOC110455211 n=1 Tax=Mizuhopecten yessoensis TaxID=6573 RepID=UPI000B459623|nr:uncharacterized protein LOC110455211 [Mizuhopecten yessoensis]